MQKKLSTVVLGGSGNVGKEAVKALIASSLYSTITLISRRPLPEMEALDPSIKVVVCDLDKLQQINLSGHSTALMALGAGKASQQSKDQLYHIDTTIPANFAKKCRADGVQHITVLSAGGADPKSEYSSITKSAAGFGWYNHCKGQMEQLIVSVGFKSVSVFHPAVIVNNTNTPGFLSWLNPKIDWMLPDKYKSISCTQLGTRMVKALNQQLRGEWDGYRLYEGANLHDPL